MKTPIHLDEDIYQAFKDFLMDACHVLASASNSPYRSFLVRKRIITEPSCVQCVLEQLPAWQRILFENEGALRALASYEKLLQLALHDVRISRNRGKIHRRSDEKPLTDHDLSNFLEPEVITRFLLNYLDGQDHAIFDEARFSQVYGSQEEWLLTETQTVRIVAMLFSFVGPDFPIVLNSEIRIRRATDADMSELINKCDHQLLEMGSRRWLLEIESKVPTECGTSSPALEIQVDRVLTALRLAKKGGVHFTHLVSGRKDDAGAWSQRQLPPTYIGYHCELISDAEISEFLTIFGVLNEVESNSSLAFVIRRFNYAYERSRVEDRFVDLIIALESILVEDGNVGEISYKFRMRAASFLAESPTLEEKGKHRDIARIAYDMRSAIVHGNVRKQSELLKKLNNLGIRDLLDLTERVEDYVRRSIKLLLGDPSQSRPDRLDQRLLGGT